MSRERATGIAVRLMKLGVSQAGIQELLSQYPYDRIERQLDYLPKRKARRPEAFIIEAVRNDYSPPKDHHHAKDPDSSSETTGPLDETPELRPGPPYAKPQGHRAEGAPGGPSPYGWLEPGGKARDIDLPAVEGGYGETEPGRE